MNPERDTKTSEDDDGAENPLASIFSGMRMKDSADTTPIPEDMLTEADALEDDSDAINTQNGIRSSRIHAGFMLSFVLTEDELSWLSIQKGWKEAKISGALYSVSASLTIRH